MAVSKAGDADPWSPRMAGVIGQIRLAADRELAGHGQMSREGRPTNGFGRLAAGYRYDVGSSVAHTRSVSDADVLARVRHGDTGSYGILYERHFERARRLARSIVNNRSDADDVVSEAFASVLSALERGKGPVDSFVPYLMRSVRNESYRANRRLGRRRAAGGQLDPHESGERRDPFASVDEVAVLRTAFESLAPRLRKVLWQTEVDELSHRDIAERTGSSPRAVAMLALRARQALGGAYLHAHLGLEPRRGQLSPACREMRPQLAALVRNRVTPMHRARLEEHLASCPACRQAHDALSRLNDHLRGLALLPAGAMARQVCRARSA